MITPEGKFIKHEDYIEMVKSAEIVEIICPVCKEMTRTQAIGNLWECLECGEIFTVGEV